MDNVSKWHPTIAEAEALRKFSETDAQRKAAKQRQKVAVIVASLFLATLFGFLLERGVR